jgi:NarL family two-component system sensor histidine kinase LiaS
MQAVQSWPLDSELIHGRLFCLHKPQMRLDDLVLGELVAQTAASRLETLHLLERLHHAAVLEERIRVAGDLHDSLLQSQAGAALQLLAARRMLDRDPHAARIRLEEVQQHLEESELELRSFIGGLRPAAAFGPLSERLEALRRRVQRQWEIEVHVDAPSALGHLPPDFADEVYRVAQEAVINAARHADATSVRLELTTTDEDVRLVISDDGRGFPFRGTYGLTKLAAMNRGPLALRERIVRLNGNLTLTSEAGGTTIDVRVPLTQRRTESYVH